MYYFVVYENVFRDEDRESIRSNVILRDIHPVVWAAKPEVAYREYFITRLLFWSEIPSGIATRKEVMKVFGGYGKLHCE